ncbi:hypothetical protein A2U01_0037511 [Trifolium medium]|uniref:Uncharacterized protein n=1 Tax=Trifolium medium TaxID=97028 RepID=A0A392PXX6_9FABA|nr:hypothetical protein [Trifolium medium]
MTLSSSLNLPKTEEERTSLGQAQLSLCPCSSSPLLRYKVTYISQQLVVQQSSGSKNLSPSWYCGCEVFSLSISVNINSLFLGPTSKWPRLDNRDRRPVVAMSPDQPTHLHKPMCPTQGSPFFELTRSLE